ncbi:MAG: hypothetical protein QNK29_14705 [Desulfobacterales bacterium]|nr:hypothetical protein [Desulfobacterales bacterium]MDX2513226.1 hypothetical protein [Desulfobacterales bacterium]
MKPDIRNKPTLSHEDILALNFIKHPCKYFFRNHFREGLRSRLMQVLKLSDITLETRGVIQHGIRMFPIAQPVAMLRIFKNKFSSRRAVQKEIDHYKFLQRWLTKSHYAVSSEFMVDYTRGRKKGILLCGLQEYVPGEAVDPWHENALLKIESMMKGAHEGALNTTLENLASFVDCIKNLIMKTGTIPDLAGVGNLIMTPLGVVKLVDINNISNLSMDHHIPKDDKGYPVSDKSIQALFQIETKILGRPRNAVDTLYRLYLDPQRMKEVREIETSFHQVTAHFGNYPSVKMDPHG